MLADAGQEMLGLEERLVYGNMSLLDCLDLWLTNLLKLFLLHRS